MHGCIRSFDEDFFMLKRLKQGLYPDCNFSFSTAKDEIPMKNPYPTDNFPLPSFQIKWELAFPPKIAPIVMVIGVVTWGDFFKKLADSYILSGIDSDLSIEYTAFNYIRVDKSLFRIKVFQRVKPGFT